ncbi:MAG: hypothetical protein OXF59_08300 [Pseudomonas sp.]|nr:hypothetical protein [Pseudomonas sp.]
MRTVKRHWGCIDGLSSNFVLEVDFNSARAELDQANEEIGRLHAEIQKLKDNHRATSINLAKHERRSHGRESVIKSLQRKNDAALTSSEKLKQENVALKAELHDLESLLREAIPIVKLGLTSETLISKIRQAISTSTDQKS